MARLDAALRHHLSTEIAAAEVCRAWRDLEWETQHTINKMAPALVTGILGLLNQVPDQRSERNRRD